jgi:phosphatidylserine/phosphatidylglycerophosphate/cardiolipin synthase-like enzyme
MKLQFVKTGLLLLLSFSIFGQESTLKTEKIEAHSIQFSWGSQNPEDVTLKFGLTKDLELGTVQGLTLSNLDDAHFYFVQANNSIKKDGVETDIQLFTTASKVPGSITVYFNQTVDNNASSITDAIQADSFEDTLVAYINSAQSTLDICNYNTGSLPIVTAINNAASSGITIRYIAADNTGTNNNELSNLSGSIPMIQRPDDGEVMHNKFMIIDAANATQATILTGSVNHTNNSCNEDYNNMVIIEDQSLALAYETEFEEMWGSNTNTPNISNSKFGDAKTDNTPHNFNIGGVPVELYFSPSDGTTAKIESAILSADTDLQFAILTFINNDLGDAVITVHDDGVQTKGIIENTIYIGSEYNSLQNAGVDVHSHLTEDYVMHHKYGIVDANNVSSDPLVITGSHNWTNSAEDDYDENTLIIHDAEIANMFYEEFMARYNDVTGGVSINENNVTQDQIQIFPNPVSGILHIQSEVEVEQIYIHNSIGQLFYQSNKNDFYQSINLSSYPKGVYFISITTFVDTQKHKFIKR